MCCAFATLLRRIVFDIDLGDEDWLRKLSSSGFTREEIYYIYDFIKSNCVSATLEGDPGTFNNLAFNLAQQWYTNTWTSQEFIPHATTTTAGSAAGTPMADLIYSLAMSRVLKTMRLSLLNEGLSSSLVFPDKSIPLKDVSFVDDMALPLVARASDLVRRIADVCGIVHVAFNLCVGWI